MEVEFIEPAVIELDDAIAYYNVQIAGLGKKFFEEVLSSIRLISKFPSAWPKYSNHTYKIPLRNFPYNLIFSIKKNKIFIIAVAHHHREPEYWINRILT